MFETNFEKKFERATKAFTKAIEEMDDIVEETYQYANDLNNQIDILEGKKSRVSTVSGKVIKVRDKLKDIFGDA